MINCTDRVDWIETGASEERVVEQAAATLGFVERGAHGGARVGAQLGEPGEQVF